MCCRGDARTSPVRPSPGVVLPAPPAEKRTPPLAEAGDGAEVISEGPEQDRGDERNGGQENRQIEWQRLTHVWSLPVARSNRTRHRVYPEWGACPAPKAAAKGPIRGSARANRLTLRDIFFDRRSGAQAVLWTKSDHFSHISGQKEGRRDERFACGPLAYARTRFMSGWTVAAMMCSRVPITWEVVPTISGSGEPTTRAFLLG